VKFLIGSFPSLFGTDVGQQLQRWCVAQGWVLAWSLGLNQGRPEPFFWTAGALRRPFPANRRLADPLVLARTSAAANASVAPVAAAAFRAAWLEANRSRSAAARANGTVSNSTWAALWDRLASALPRSLRLQPLRADSCADVERCVGTTLEGRCVCYQPDAAAEGLAVLV